MMLLPHLCDVSPPHISHPKPIGATIAPCSVDAVRHCRWNDSTVEDRGRASRRAKKEAFQKERNLPRRLHDSIHLFPARWADGDCAGLELEMVFFEKNEGHQTLEEEVYDGTGSDSVCLCFFLSLCLSVSQSQSLRLSQPLSLSLPSWFRPAKHRAIRSTSQGPKSLKEKKKKKAHPHLTF